MINNAIVLFLTFNSKYHNMVLHMSYLYDILLVKSQLTHNLHAHIRAEKQKNVPSNWINKLEQVTDK